jgi:hypothetical protein
VNHPFGLGWLGPRVGPRRAGRRCTPTSACRSNSSSCGRGFPARGRSLPRRRGTACSSTTSPWKPARVLDASRPSHRGSWSGAACGVRIHCRI